VIVLDGLNASIKNWQDHIIHTIRLYGMQMPLACSMCEYREKLGHDEYGRGTRDMELEFVLRRPTHIGLTTMNEPTFKVMDTIADPLRA
jgi:hypothetical protein